MILSKNQLVMKHDITIIFILQKYKANSKGLAPIYCRITRNYERKHFSTGFRIKPDEWDSATSTVIKNPLSPQINAYIIAIKARALEITLKYKLSGKAFTLHQIANEILDRKSKNLNTLLKVFSKHNDEVRALVGKSYSPATLQKFEGIYKQTEAFIRHTYKEQDILLSDLKLKFLMDFEYYMLTERDMKQVSVNKTLQRIRKIARYAIAHEYMEKDPFMLFKAKTVHLDVVFLDSEELSILEQYELEKEKLIRVRDMFVFCCYTGLAYREMSELSKENIIKGADDKDWIKITRQKTSKPLMVPLLPKAKAILDKYYSLSSDKLLPQISNQKFNTNLKELADIIGIKKKMSHHVARKTFASTVLLYNDVPMEIVSELLGHSSMKTTQRHYGKVVNKKLGEQMDELGKKLK